MLKLPILVMVACLCLGVSNAPAFFMQDAADWDRFRLPENFQGHAERRYEQNEEWKYWDEVDFSIGMSYVYLNRYRILKGVGRTVIDVRFDDLNESILISPLESQVQRTRRFEQTYTEAGEIEISPFPILRVLHFQSDQIKIHASEETEQGVVTIQFSGKDGLGYGISEIDIQGDRIIEYRSGKANERFISTIRYQEWVDLPSGDHVPTKIYSDTFDPQSEAVTRLVIRVSDIVELKPDFQPPKPPTPPGFTVIDHIDGVSKVDGEVLGQINYGKVEDSSNRRNATRGKQASNWLIWLGVGLVVLAGFLLRNRSKAAC